MSIPQSAGGPIESRDDLVRYLAEGSKPKSEWRIGTEHEKFMYCLKTRKPLPYEGRPGIRVLLESMRALRLEAGDGGRIHHRPQPERRRDQPGAGRPVRAFRRAAQVRP